MRVFRQQFPWSCLAVLVAVGGCFAFAYFFIGYFQWRNCWFPPRNPDVEVIVSACEEPFLSGASPNGRFVLYVTRYDTNKKSESWMLDVANRRSQLNSGCGEWWLGNELRLGYLASPDELEMSFYVCELNNNRRIQLKLIPELKGNITLQQDGKWELDQKGLISRAPNGELVFSSTVTEGFRRADATYYFPERDWAFALNNSRYAVFLENRINCGHEKSPVT